MCVCVCVRVGVCVCVCMCVTDFLSLCELDLAVVLPTYLRTVESRALKKRRIEESLPRLLA